VPSAPRRAARDDRAGTSGGPAGRPRLARQRIFWLHVPTHYSPAHLVPLVLAFHGGNGTGLRMQAGSGLSRLANQDGFLVAYPQGLRQPQGDGTTGWDASGPRDPYAHGIDDGLFVSDVLNSIQAGYCVDPRRIAATGISNGGSMAGYLACVLAGRIAAFVPVEGVFSRSRPAVIRCTRPRSLTFTC
jgi:polyhydroxybutyrate depolymerase